MLEKRNLKRLFTRMKVVNPLILQGFGLSLTTKSGYLRVKSYKDVVAEFHPRKFPYDMVLLHSSFGSFSLESLLWLSFHNVPLLFMSFKGEPLVRILPTRFETHGKLRVEQVRSYLNTETRLYIAKKIVEAKTGTTLNGVNSIRALLVAEGREDLKKWETLKREVFDKTKFQFSIRSGKRENYNKNASDEINSLLNYSYSILEAISRKAISAYGLDSSIGYLHGIAEGKEPLVYDMQEPFRVICETSVCELLPSLKKTDFYRDKANYTVRLTHETALKLLEVLKTNFEKRYPFNGEKRTGEGLVFLAVQNLTSFLLRKRELFIPSLAFSQVSRPVQ
jgi:CRISPR-associated protein Cas1